MRQFNFTWTTIGWLLIGYGLSFIPSHAQAQAVIKKFSLELKNESLPEALKQIEKMGGKNILFAYEETENYHVTASIRKQTQDEAICTVLKGKPFNCIERTDYFVIQRKGKDGNTTQVRGTIYGDRNEPLAYANVILLAAADSTLLQDASQRKTVALSYPATMKKNIC